MSDNKAVITCPIFNAKAPVASCVELRNRVWRGEAVSVRKGCQACMASGKCPIAREFNHFVHSKLNTGVYLTSDEPKEVKLRAEILEEIRPVIVQDQHLTRAGVPATEQQLIASANERIDAQLKTAPKNKAAPLVDRTKRDVFAARTTLPQRPKFVERDPARTAAMKAAEDHDSKINIAAATGDMSAAINAHTA